MTRTSRLAHVDQAVAPVALLAREMENVGPGYGEMRRHVACDGVGEAPADQKGLGAPVGEQRHHVVQLAVGQVAEGLAHVLQCRLEQRREAESPGRRRVDGPRQGRLQLGRQLVLERGLELRIVLEADAGDETQDGRRTDAGLAGEIGDGLEADHGIVRHQRLSGAPLPGGHQADAVSDALGDAGSCSHPACSIRPIKVENGFDKRSVNV